jgi:hypothetical protein
MQSRGHLVKNFSLFIEQVFLCRVCMIAAPVPVLSQMNPIHMPKPCFTNIHHIRICAKVFQMVFFLRALKKRISYLPHARFVHRSFRIT